jgi:hypothetical protein
MNLAQSLNIEADFETSYLVNCLRNHRDAHRKDYEEAWANYLIVRAAKAKEIAKVANKLANSPEQDKHGLMEAYNSLVALTKPVNATEMYNQYITLLEASTSDTVTMDVNDANAIINDKWKWAQDAKFSNSFYSNFKG